MDSRDPRGRGGDTGEVAAHCCLGGDRLSVRLVLETGVVKESTAKGLDPAYDAAAIHARTLDADAGPVCHARRRVSVSRLGPSRSTPSFQMRLWQRSSASLTLRLEPFELAIQPIHSVRSACGHSASWTRTVLIHRGAVQLPALVGVYRRLAAKCPTAHVRGDVRVRARRVHVLLALQLRPRGTGSTVTDLELYLTSDKNDVGVQLLQRWAPQLFVVGNKATLSSDGDWRKAYMFY